MLRTSHLLVVATLLMGVGSVSASTPKSPASQVASPAAVSPVQYGGRCFSACVSGRIFRRCQNEHEAKRENCCSVACNRFNSWTY
jgi:hypothetical protein